VNHSYTTDHSTSPTTSSYHSVQPTNFKTNIGSVQRFNHNLRPSFHNSTEITLSPPIGDTKLIAPVPLLQNSTTVKNPIRVRKYNESKLTPLHLKNTTHSQPRSGPPHTISHKKQLHQDKSIIISKPVHKLTLQEWIHVLQHPPSKLASFLSVQRTLSDWKNIFDHPPTVLAHYLHQLSQPSPHFLEKETSHEDFDDIEIEEDLEDEDYDDYSGYTKPIQSDIFDRRRTIEEWLKILNPYGPDTKRFSMRRGSVTEWFLQLQDTAEEYKHRYYLSLTACGCFSVIILFLSFVIFCKGSSSKEVKQSIGIEKDIQTIEDLRSIAIDVLSPASKKKISKVSIENNDNHLENENSDDIPSTLETSPRVSPDTSDDEKVIRRISGLALSRFHPNFKR